MRCRKFLCLISNLSEAFVKPKFLSVRSMAQFSCSAGTSTTDTTKHDHVTKHYNSFLLPPNDIIGMMDDEMKREMRTNHRHGLLLLNSDTMDASWVKRFWDHCEFKICADGGANRLYDGLVDSGDVHKYIPDMIKGDLDSLRADVKAFYSAAGTSIVYDFDQVDTLTHLITHIHMHSFNQSFAHSID